MFEGFAKGRARKNRWKAPMLASGAVIHAAMFTGMWIHGLWEIKKVEAAAESLSLVTQMPIPKVEEAGPAVPKPKDKPVKRVAKDPTQPEEKKPETPEVVPTTTGNEEPTTGGPGDPDGVPTDGATPEKDVPPEKPKQVVEKETKREETKVPPSVLKRISGETLILPDAETAQQIARGETKKVRGSVRLCLGADGNVRSASIQQSTQFTAYDEKLEREMRKWRYRPHEVNGVATPVCTQITVIFQQR